MKQNNIFKALSITLFLISIFILIGIPVSLKISPNWIDQENWSILLIIALIVGITSFINSFTEILSFFQNLLSQKESPLSLIEFTETFKPIKDFVGREEEIKKIRKLLREKKNRNYWYGWYWKNRVSKKIFK